ncbi:MAG: biopolymer transporter ExbD [Polyangiaceae bacterium]
MAFGPADTGKGQKPVVNVTPLVDVALVVLIIFMVVAPMLTRTLSMILPPQADASSTPSSDAPIVMTMSKGGGLELNRQSITRDELATAIPAALAATRNKVVHFDADDEIPYGEVIATVDACRGAGANNIAIVTKKLSTNPR